MTDTAKITLATQIAAVVALIAILMLGLLPALLAGLLVYQLVEFGARRLSRIGVIPDNGRIILLLLVSLIFTALIAFGIISLMAQFANGPESVVALFQKMADVVDVGRNYLPEWAQVYIPGTINECRRRPRTGCAITPASLA
jgi:predicted PurR-regulated permease PerM